MKNSQNGFVGVLVVIIVLIVLIGGGIYIYNAKKSEAPAAVTTDATTDTEAEQVNTQTETVTASSTKLSYKKYQGPNSDFYFNIPSTWNIRVAPKPELYIQQGWKWNAYTVESPDFKETSHEDDLPYVVLDKGASIAVQEHALPDHVATIGEMKEFNAMGRDSGSNTQNERMIKIDGADALLYDTRGREGALGYKLDIVHDGSWVGINIIYKGVEGKEVLDTLLSTFKFASK